jgi:hypothetical protein
MAAQIQPIETRYKGYRFRSRLEAYAHLGDELLFELVALCLSCHEKVHGRPIG